MKKTAEKLASAPLPPPPQIDQATADKLARESRLWRKEFARLVEPTEHIDSRDLQIRAR